VKRNHKIEISYKEIFYKGTVTLLTTLGAGALFGRKNMMIAFSLGLGAGALSTQNLKIKPLQKTLQLIGVDLLIVCIAYIASLNRWVAIPINLVTIFGMIYFNISFYNENKYRTFLMLYVFCQYSSITFMELPARLAMIVFAVSIIVASIYIEQSQNKRLLPPQIEKAFKLINEQLALMSEGKFDKDLGKQVGEQMNELAYVIYRSSFKQYFTTYMGKIHFYFYLNIGYFNILLEQIHSHEKGSFFALEEIKEIYILFQGIQSYFKRQITRKTLLELFNSYLNLYPDENDLKGEVRDVLFALKESFKELGDVPIKDKHHVYDEWERGDLRHLKQSVSEYFSPKKMRFNFAIRMTLIITIALFLAQLLGFHKFIWAIIPIISITQPYVEDTRKRRGDRFESNILGAVVLAIILDIVRIKGLPLVLLIASFYLYHAYKDYYHTSLFLTIISMCVSTVSIGINTLLVYRVIYVLLGVTVVEITSRWMPYHLEDGIQELMLETERLNDILEEESILSLKGEADFNRIRQAIICSAILCQKLYVRNKAYKNKEVDELVRVNTEFIIRLGHRLLSKS